MTPLSPPHSALLSEVLSAFLIADSIDRALSNILELVGCHFKVSRVYICESINNNSGLRVTHEWVAAGILPCQSLTEKITPEVLARYYAQFDANNILYLSDITKIEGPIQNILVQNHVRSLLQAAFVHNEHTLGLVGFDDCTFARTWSPEDISFLSMLSQLLAVFIMNKHSQRSSRMGEALILKILNYVGGFNYIIDIETHNLIYFNEALRQVIPDVALSKPCYSFFHTEQNTSCPFCPVRIYKENPSKLSSEFDYYNQQYNLWMHVQSLIFEWFNGRMVCFLHSVDLADKRDYEQRLETLAFVDETTGIANNRCYEKKAPVLLDLARKSNHQVALIALKLEGLHRINSARGHKRGDVLLKAFARCVQRLVPGGGFFARVRGNDFVLLYPFGHDHGKTHIQALMQRLYETIGHIDAPGSLKGWLTTSAGISLFPSDGEHIEDLHRKATLSIPNGVQSKSSYAFYDPALMSRLFKRDKLAHDLAHAVTNGELKVFHQPKHNLLQSRIAGTEALVRWQHPELGLLDGGTFIPLAEELNLVADIDEWVLFESCRQIRQLLDSNSPVVPVSINISPDKFYQDDILQQLQAALDTYRIPPELIEVELTERLALENLEHAAKIMRRIRNTGIKISIDDFGTGYSSLNYLRMIPFDVIKVDRTFAADIETNSTAQGIVETIVGLARLLNATVVFEGIENIEQYNFACRAGCTMVQGFYTDHPMPLDQLEAKLRLQGVPKLSAFSLPGFIHQHWHSFILFALVLFGGILGSACSLMFSADLPISKTVHGLLITLCILFAAGMAFLYQRHARLKTRIKDATRNLVRACKNAWEGDQATSLPLLETNLLADVTTALDTTIHKFHDANASFHADEQIIARLEQQLREQNEKYRIVSETFHGVIWELDLRTQVMTFSPSFTALFGHKQRNYTYPDNFMTLLHPDDCDSLYHGVQSAIHGDISTFEMVTRLRSLDGIFHWINCTGAIMYDAIGNAESFVGSFEGIDVASAAPLVRAQRPSIDPLTGITNRLEGELMLNMCLCAITCPCLLLFIDIQNLRRINENHGQLCGDTILRELAARLSCFATRDDVLFRYGSDNFVLFVNNGRHAELIKKFMDEIFRTLSTPYVHLQTSIAARSRAGVTLVLPDCTDVALVLEKVRRTHDLAEQSGQDYVIANDASQPESGDM